MEKYNYLEQETKDVIEYINENYEPEGIKKILADEDEREEFREALNDDLFTEDSVTGNASGSYTFNTWEAEENICHNLDLLQDALEDFCCDPAFPLEKGAEWADVTIRCYLLGQAIDAALDELTEEDKE